jgi:plasmid maintenance system killer protein
MVGSKFAPGDDRTIFMDTYAMQAKWHMWKYGTTQEQIAVGAAKNHNYGALNDKAQYRFQMTTQSVMQDRPVSYPLTRAMRTPIGDGAAALLCSKEYLEKLPNAVKERAIRIAGVGFSGGKYRSPDEPGLTRAASDKAYRMAGLEPQDIDVAEMHDATSCGVGGDPTAGLKLIALIAYRDAVYYLSMIRSFGDRKTQALFEDELVRAFHGFADRAKRKLVAIHVAARLDDLRMPPANRLEKLRGDLDGFHSIRINDQWRVIFRWADGDAHGVRIVDYH